MDMSEQEIEQQNTVTDDNRMILRTENLVKKYGKRTVVSHVSFDVKQGCWDRMVPVRLLRFI